MVIVLDLVWPQRVLGWLGINGVEVGLFRVEYSFRLFVRWSYFGIFYSVYGFQHYIDYIPHFLICILLFIQFEFNF